MPEILALADDRLMVELRLRNNHFKCYCAHHVTHVQIIISCKQRQGKIMEVRDIISKLADIMIDVFDVDDLNVNETTSADDIAEWDSMTHVRFMITVERDFNIKFKNEEFAGINNVGDLARVIQTKLGG